MEEIIDLLEKIFKHDARYHNYNEIKSLLKLKGETKERILEDALKKLEEDGKIFYDKKQGYKIFPSQAGYAYGEIEINRDGLGFVHTSNNYTIVINNNDLNGALNGDKVIVYNILSKGKNFYQGEIYRVLKRKTGNLIFQVIGNGLNCSIVPYNKAEYVDVDINYNEFKNLVDGELILVNVGCNSIDGKYEGTIIKTIGHIDDPDIDIKLILEKHEIHVDFSDEVLDEINKIPTSVEESDLVNRVDLRNENIFTIDCDNTKDRDDAVSIKKLDNGNFLLKVSIAHVSHYIKQNSKVFSEALMRCSSHYPADKCIPMLPHTISNGICSLNPNVDRLTRTVEMEIDSEGDIVNYNIYNSVINSKIAMSYSKVNKLLNGELIDEYKPFEKDLMLMQELNSILESARNKRNYINFNTSEVEVLKNENNYEFKPNNLGVAGQIIENFMIMANTTVYKHFAWFVLAYRVHEAPSEKRVMEVLDLLRSSNIKIPKIKNVDSRSIKGLIDALDDNDLSIIVRECLLKSMKKARYDINNVGHFALQYDVYGHFTSPIRRIIDLITNMTIDNIENFDYSAESIENFEKFLSELCEKTNSIEKISKQIEEETLDMLMAKYMSDHIGEEYEVRIIDIGTTYLLVRTQNLIRGRISLKNLPDDMYYYDYEKKAIIGKNTKNKYQIGNKLTVTLKDASKETRTINFEVQKTKKLEKMP